MSLQMLRRVQQAQIQQTLNTSGIRSMFRQSQPRFKAPSKPGHVYINRPSCVRSSLPINAVSSRSISRQVQRVNLAASNPSQAVIWAIISINTAVFLAWQFGIANRQPKLLKQLQDSFMLSLNNLREGRLYTLLTSAFSHIGLSHLLFNMFTFYSFATGLTIVAGLASSQLLTLSCLAAIGGSIAWVVERGSQDQRRVRADLNGSEHAARALGASGLVMGLGSALTCLRPFLPMNLMFIPIPIPLWVVTILYAAGDFYFMGSNTGIGHAAHLGGGAVGVLYYALFLRKFGGVWAMLVRHK